MDLTKLVSSLDPKVDEEFTFGVAPVERRLSSRRSSLFGLDKRGKNPPSPAKTPATTPESAYADALLTEQQQWDALLLQAAQHNARIANSRLQITMDDLSVEQRNYFQAVPDFQRFQADGERFVRRATFHLQTNEDFVQRRNAIVAHANGAVMQAAVCMRRKL